MTTSQNQPLNIDTRVRQWRDDGYFVEEWSLAPGDSWTDDGHPGDEFVLLLNGQLEIQLNDQVIAPAVGEHIFIPAGQRHTVRNIGERPSTICWAHAYKYDGDSQTTEAKK